MNNNYNSKLIICFSILIIFIGIFSNRLLMAKEISLYILGRVEWTQDIKNVIKTLYEAKSTDVVTINVSSNGGSVDTMIQIVSAMKDSKAKVNTKCLLICLSAGAGILLAGDEKTHKDTSLFMLHLANNGQATFPHNHPYQIFFTPWFDKHISPYLNLNELLYIACGGNLYFQGHQITELVTRENQSKFKLKELVKTTEGRACNRIITSTWEIYKKRTMTIILDNHLN